MRNFKIITFIACIFLLANVQLHAQSSEQLSEEEVFLQAEKNIELYRKGDVKIHVVDHDGKVVKGIKVSVNQVSHDFLFGALLFDLTRNTIDPAREELFKARFLELFNYGILPFYWGGYEYVPGHPQWEGIDRTLDWCLENDILPKGHPLAWTHKAGMPGYIMDMPLEDSEKLLEARIYENVLGFPDIAIWDVVNEPVNTVNWEMAHADKEANQRYTNSIPLEDIADWVEKAYKTADRANPNKHLVLNEFKQFADPGTRDRFYRFVELLLERNTPIDGLGIQAHEPREDWYSPVDVWNTLNLYTDFGLPLHITEFSPQSRGAAIEGGYKAGTWTEETQTEFAEMMYRLCFAHPSVKSINWWGFSDINAWLPGCGITDDDLNPKPVFHMLKKLIKEEWMTTGLELVSDKKGSTDFRGFYGDYKIEVTSRDGEKQESVFHLEQGKENVWKLVIK